MQLLPPVDFCCAYGSALLSCNQNKNLEKNRDHYASWMAYLGPRMITKVADGIGVGVHFNPFVALNDERMIKYGVVRMHDLVQDLLNWESFYLSCRLQKPVYATQLLGVPGLLDIQNNFKGGICSCRQFGYRKYRNTNLVNLEAVTSAALLLLPPEFTEGDLYAKISALSYMGDLRMLFAEARNRVYVLADNLDIGNTNLVNLEAVTSAALLLLPPEFTEGDLYAKICALSYMGDLRMLFAEDRNRVKKIVQGSFGSFQAMYKPFLDEFAAKGLLKISLSGGRQAAIKQDSSLSASRSLVSTLPQRIRSKMGMRLQGNGKPGDSGQMVHKVAITSLEEAALCIQKVIRRLVMVSSARQAVSGVSAAGGVNAW